MASPASKSATSAVLFLNLIIYFIIIVISSWAMNHAITHSHDAASGLKDSAHIFPIFFPMGNMATGLFIILSLVTGVVGFMTSLTGLNDVMIGTSANLNAASSAATVTCLLTLLSMGLACKEIDISWAGHNLRALEVLTIVASGSQLLCVVAIQVGVAREAVGPRIPPDSPSLMGYPAIGRATKQQMKFVAKYILCKFRLEDYGDAFVT